MGLSKAGVHKSEIQNRGASGPSLKKAYISSRCNLRSTRSTRMSGVIRGHKNRHQKKKKGMENLSQLDPHPRVIFMFLVIRLQNKERF